MKIIVIGGNAAGMSAAAKARRENEDAQILVFDKGKYFSWANCGMPYYIGKKISELEKLTVVSKSLLEKRYKLELFPETEIIKINKEEKYVIAKDGQEEKKYIYDKLIIATGASSVFPAFPGRDLKGIFTLNNLEDLRSIDEYIEKATPKKAAVIGAGFIGLEMAENLKQRGLEVSIIEKLPWVFPLLDIDMAKWVSKELEGHSINIYTNIGAKEFIGAEKVKKIILEDNSEIEADMVIVAIGVKPNTDIAKDAGLEMDIKNTIKVNENLQTSDENIYAAGDVIAVNNLITKEKQWIPLATYANKAGRIAGANAADENNKMKFIGGIGTSIVKLFDLSIARCGLSEIDIKKKNIKAHCIIVHPGAISNYYENRGQVNIKLWIETETDKILGAQVIGKDKVDKVIDVISTAIYGNLKASELSGIDLAYAPPFSTAKHPVNIAGMVSYNVFTKKSDIVSFSDIDKIDNKILLDVRTPGELKTDKIDTCMNIPVDSLRENLDKIDKETNIIVYCYQGLRGYLGERILKNKGFKKVYNLTGGLLSKFLK